MKIIQHPMKADDQIGRPFPTYVGSTGLLLLYLERGFRASSVTAKSHYKSLLLRPLP